MGICGGNGGVVGLVGLMVLESIMPLSLYMYTHTHTHTQTNIQMHTSATQTVGVLGDTGRGGDEGQREGEELHFCCLLVFFAVVLCVCVCVCL